jgi:predicted dehydrogenase
MTKKRYAVIGLGGRGLEMFARPLTKELAEAAELAALCDANPVRAAYANTQLGGKFKTFTDFDKMLREVKFDALMIATPDHTHAKYVVAGLKAGKRVFCEKPLCTTAADCRAILGAVKETGGTCMVTHNARYGPGNRNMRGAIKNGWVGQVKFMSFVETLDRRHGADYFRRWHKFKANSGGLQLQKSSHHFDFLNWLAESKPVTLRAQGGLKFYGRNNTYHGKRCRGCEHARRCEFYVDAFQNEFYKKIYLEAEGADGYHRDGCVWDPAIDIEDQFQAHIQYENGIQVDYSLIAYSPVESQHIVVEGTLGRLEHDSIHNSAWALGHSAVTDMDKLVGERQRLLIPGRDIWDLPIPKVEGGHGGADPQLRNDFFVRPWTQPPTPGMASVEQAVQAVLLGAAVNKSLAAGGAVVDVQDLLVRD